MKHYELNRKNIFKHSQLYIVIAISFPIVARLVFYLKSGYHDTNVALILGGIGLLIYSIIFFFIHFNHYLKSRNCILEIDLISDLYIFRTTEKETKFYGHELARISVFKSWPLARNESPIFAWDHYHYMKFELKNGDVIKISSLLIYEPEKELKLRNVELKRVLFAWM